MSNSIASKNTELKDSDSHCRDESEHNQTEAYQNKLIIILLEGV